MEDKRSNWVTDEQLKKVEEVIEKEEGVTRKPSQFWSIVITVLAVATSLFAIYCAVGTVTTQILRGVHVALILTLIFLYYPATKAFRSKITLLDLVPAFLALTSIAYMFFDFEEFIYRSVTPELWDEVFGIILIVVILEATRRTSGWIMPITVILFLVYAYVGPSLPAPWTHRGYDISRIVGHMYMTLEGIFGVPIDVSSTFIIMFTIFGAFLQTSGAGRFYVDFAFTAMGRKPTGAGRTVVLASFFLAGASGSGVANTVTVGSVAYPMLQKAGYDRENAGGFLAAGGIGAVLTPPVMGAAAFLIAEFLKISYLDVIKMAFIPACLYYFGLLLMIEFDARKFGMKLVETDEVYDLKTLTWKYGFHFLPLVTIIAFLVAGYTPSMAVFFAILTCFFASFCRKETRFTPAKLVQALKFGSIGVLNVAVVCACAGIIVGVVSLTGLGLKLSTIIITYAGGNLILTAIFTGILLWILGLAVPITATYIIAAVIAAPALTKLGVPDYAAHMFIFYYAVLSEVSPPTALSPFAAAALTGGDPFKTTMMAWKYTIVAFIIPFIFTVHPSGLALLLKGTGSVFDMLWTLVTSFMGVFAIASAASGWLLTRTRLMERVLLVAGGLSLIYPSAWGDVAGLALMGLALISQFMARRSHVLEPDLEKA
ncbi:TRAP transporter permease [Desulfomonile tiedjei]|uniref:TRAP transporter, 4TM/12TM fusion protein n=1 Tax=Desulfomonile tiedjei (strain ATCC 49306 / DSM 6799 / DCB-1) TaxID=706587 RepID=I4C1V7_DESTA|nr:TRAP transporter fused permease subunit [Desulfomonile tiedjei]AFM23548.1 TRAP transporter, 4TM/12TM fusion protein [Desulfomonile tiedjei DSM 6799]